MTLRAGGLAVLGGMGLVVLGIASLFFILRMHTGQSVQEANSKLLLPTSPAARPQKIPDGNYVGSQACKSCHAEIYESYARHPMGKSAEFLPSFSGVEDYSTEKSEFAGNKGYRYRVETKDDSVIHHEIESDPRSGDVLYDQAAVVSLAVGAGVRGRSYAVNHDGILLQSPITWYGASGGHFNLSPGYHQQEFHFNRQWTSECLACHTGRIEVDESSPSRIIFKELAIGCERCHGPGESHVQLQSSTAVSSPDRSIVNPSRLGMRERESVCYDCHLEGAYRTPRYGRIARDFRPGMALDEVACILVESVSASGSTEVVSQVEQMWNSRCFIGSEGKLGCISCHDPHDRPTAEQREEFYRSRCNQCHSEGRGCSLPLARREKQRDSCIACHMAPNAARNVVHVSQTDHRVPRHAHKPGQPAVQPRSDHDLQFFDHSDDRLPHWEVLRARCLERAEHGANSTDDVEFESLVRAIAQVAPDDAPLFNGVGNYYLRQSRFGDARIWYEKTIAVDANHESALAGLATACQGMNDMPAALKYIDRSLKLNPWIAPRHALRAEVLFALGDRSAAAAAAKKAIELDASEGKRLGRLAGSKDE